MDFYTSIAENYDDIFPYNPQHKSFIDLSLNQKNQEVHLLDIGSGTCNLSIELAKKYHQVTAIDLDAEMLKKGKEKAKNFHPNLRILQMDMTTIDEHFSENSFDLISCFGNTLVHLDGIKEIKTFFDKVLHCLKPNGVFLMQVIHYDRIIQNKVTALKTIENEKIQFIRNYYYKKDINKLDFETILTLKKDNKKIKNTIELYPVLKDELLKALHQAGFKNLEFFGNFKLDPLSNQSIPLLIRARKMNTK